MGSKTRSLSYILLKPCVHSRGHSFASIFMQFHQNICLDNTSIKFEYGSCQIKKVKFHQIFVCTLNATVLLQVL